MTASTLNTPSSTSNPVGRRHRVLTGDRPTGPLHLGHYFGTVINRIRLQEQGEEVFLVVADYQVITDRDDPGRIADQVLQLVTDYLACGLDPDDLTIFAHSAIPELNQLMLPFLSLVGTGELDRNPTVKDEIRLSGRPSVSGLMLTYPVHQAADILFCKADLVPVGRDQLPHLELTRSIARRFNDRYGTVFPVPEALLGDAPLLAGLDGRKMSKSLGNAIALKDDPDTVRAKLKAARTDSQRVISFEPDRRPEVANLLILAGLCQGVDPREVAEQVGGGGAAALKQLVTDSVNDFLAPIRARRSSIEAGDAARILQDGSARARAVAEQTLGEVTEAMGMKYGGLYRSR